MSTTTGAELSSSRTNLALGTLFLGAFVVGSAELIVVGVLNLIAEDTNVSISTAGTLVTAYSLAISVGGPLLTALTIRYGRRFLLRLSLAAYVGGNLLAALAMSFGMLFAARILTGALHGLFMGVAFAVGAALVPPDRMGRAFSMVFGGFAVAVALGLPLGAFIGNQLGWQAAFFAIVAVGAVAVALMLTVVPVVPNTGVGGASAQARYALAPRVLAVLGVGFLLMGGQYAALTYITPFLDEVTGISGPSISVFLLAYGVFNAVGTFAGGWAADRGATTTLIAATAVLVVSLAGLYMFGATPLLVALALAVFGLVGFGLVPSLQHRVVMLAGPGRDLAATLPQSAVTAGIAVGALVGGWALASYGPSAAVVTGLVSCAIALPLTWATSFLKPPAVEAAGPDAVSAEVAADGAPPS